MRIYQKDADGIEIKTARRFSYRDGSAPRYRIFPADRQRNSENVPLNTIQQEIAFLTAEEAAKFLLLYPDASIRMEPEGKIVRSNIVIDRDGDEPTNLNDTLKDADAGEGE
ncbi:hypothetical protein GGR95_002443 [Sulfitobacter undariae]|uniref:Uncharacterized protein n=1 Tax=Sulfitobacter undariae TaxID=1563671 RepID=A0A7W6E5Z7_9RHOB|nr:hypothetical protein [Sulfitobacter undariae]MBB3994794.1 hypothetical protein [Sulfitobacter undariae]